VRVSDFRSLSNIEVNLNELTVLVGANNAGKSSLLDAIQFSIGASRRILGKEDIRLGKDETDVPKDRRAVIDILIRPTDADGASAETFAEGSFWTGLWGTGIAQDEDQNDMVGIRSVLEWSGIHGDYRTTRNFLKEWKPFDDWQEAEIGDSVSVGHIEPIALHYIDAKRDLEDDLRTRGSFWRRLTDDLGLNESDTEELESALSAINKTLFEKSEVLKHLREHLLELKNVIAFEKAGIDIAPVPRHLRDLSRGVDVSLTSGGASAFPLTRHGMGTRSLASLLVFRAFASWRRERAEEGGDEVHTLPCLLDLHRINRAPAVGIGARVGSEQQGIRSLAAEFPYFGRRQRGQPRADRVLCPGGRTDQLLGLTKARSDRVVPKRRPRDRVEIQTVARHRAVQFKERHAIWGEHHTDAAERIDASLEQRRRMADQALHDALRALKGVLSWMK
jgi:putative ATP-dependent endonuclease of OLD family